MRSRVAIAKRSAADDWSLQRFEIRSRNDAPVEVPLVGSLRGSAARHLKWPESSAAAVERHTPGPAGRFHAGNCPHAIQKLVSEGGTILLVQAGERQIHFDGVQARHFEAGIDRN